MAKSTAAFRTIREVAEELDLKQHVLRFWETKFIYIKPMKRGGGRRYYRPEDIALLVCIRDLLYKDGYTIKGVQKLLRDAGGKPDKIQDGLAQAQAKPKPKPKPKEHSKPDDSTGTASMPIPTQDTSSGSLPPQTRDELGAVLEELIQLKSKLDGAIEHSTH